MCDTLYLQQISSSLEMTGKDDQYFRCREFFEDQKTAQVAARALHRHLLKSGGRLGGFSIKMSEAKRRKHGISWRATKVSPVKAVVVKNRKLF